VLSVRCGRAESKSERHKEKKKKKTKKDRTVKEKTRKDGTLKEKKKIKEDSDKRSPKERDGSTTVRKSTKGEKTQTTRISTSSFEIGHLSASPEAPKATVSKKHSILGLGLPSAMRLPRMRRFNCQLSQPQCGLFARSNQSRCSVQ
jgi:serine/arginine repetitive matrix protein 2